MSIQSSDLGSGEIPLTLRAKSCDRIMKHFKQLQEIVSKIHSKDLYDSSYTNDKLLEIPLRGTSTKKKLLEFLFDNFFELGLVLEESNFTLKDMPESLIQPIISTVIKFEKDISLLASEYEYDDMNLPFNYTDKDASYICRFRSGLQYLLENFNGFSKDLDRVLDWIKFYIDDFDDSLTSWMTWGEGTLQAGDINPRIPKSHYWWFLNGEEDPIPPNPTSQEIVAFMECCSLSSTRSIF